VLYFQGNTEIFHGPVAPDEGIENLPTVGQKGLTVRKGSPPLNPAGAAEE